MLSVTAVKAQTNELSTEFNGYIDVMYSTRFNNSLSSIPYSMQPSVNNTPNVNLAYLATVTRYKKLSLHTTIQAGDYTKNNYSGSDYDIRFIQELNVQYKSDALEIDLGVMPAHTGYCNTTGMNNLVVTQTLLADATLYYVNGLKVQYSFPNVTASVLVVQGWQRITDNNNDKSIGTALCWSPDSTVKVNYNTLTGNDMDNGYSLRSYHDMWSEVKIDRTTIALIGNFAVQQGKRPMLYVGGQAQYKITDDVAIAGRYENVNDRDQVVFTTPMNYEFVCHNYSVNLDWKVSDMIGLRGEIRTTHATKKIFNGYPSMTFMTFCAYFHV